MNLKYLSFFPMRTWGGAPRGAVELYLQLNRMCEDRRLH